jgi:pimeloyl-ACP methyl ester carboxylesterase
MLPPRVEIVSRMKFFILPSAFGLWIAVVFGALSSAAERVTIDRNDQQGTLTILVSSQGGLVDWSDVVRGLARAAELDEEIAVQELETRRIDLHSAHTRLTIRTLSAAAPDLKLRVVTGPNTDDPQLRIQMDRDGAREKMRSLKALFREKFTNDDRLFAFELDSSWGAQPRDRPLIVLVHGYSSGAESLSEFGTVLKKAHWPVATFSYPNDGPLAASANRLALELREFREDHPSRAIVVVAHSMGGLVARAAVEDPNLDPGNVKALIMVCTPNHGSQWARLPAGLELWDYFRSSQLSGVDERFRHSIADGLNEARSDLKPDSFFLRQLNARSRNPKVCYSLILGTTAPCTAAELSECRQQVIHVLSQKEAGRLFLPKVNGFWDDFQELECGKGDWVVTVERGQLDGVEDTVLMPITHWTFSNKVESSQQQTLFDAILARLHEKNADPVGPK